MPNLETSWLPRRKGVLLGRPSWALLILVLGLLVLRCATLDVLGFIDTTESRYAMIACDLLDRESWLMPHVWRHDALVPYWGKPPLSAWVTAWSFREFGVSTLAARLPSFASATLIVALVYWFARRVMGRVRATHASIILISCCLFFVLAGVCLTDVLFSAWYTASGVAFVLHASRRASRSDYSLSGLMFFVSLGFGTLTKGPVAVALAALAILALGIVRRDWASVRRLPWRSGALAFSAICVPWFVLAEVSHPGFLRYYIVHEHLSRFAGSGTGDYYGNPHSFFRGVSLVWLAVATLPWTPLLVSFCRRSTRRGCGYGARALLGVTCFALAPVVFFAFSRNVLITYLLPSLPFAAVGAARANTRLKSGALAGRVLLWLRRACYAAAIVVGAFAFFERVYIAAVISWGGVAALWWRDSRSADNATSRVSSGSLAAVWVATSWLLSTATFHNQHRSTRDLVHAITAARPHARFAFAGKVPDSARLYARSVRRANMGPSNEGLWDFFSKADADDVLVMRSDRCVTTRPEGVRAIKVGRYTAYFRRASPAVEHASAGTRLSARPRDPALLE